MSFTEVMAELPSLSLAERHLLIRRALELDETELSDDEVTLVDERLAGHHQNPSSSLSLEEMKARVQRRLAG
jgi:Arc/MetJ-type ribon-helix-helix transcriptional regulator